MNYKTIKELAAPMSRPGFYLPITPTRPMTMSDEQLQRNIATTRTMNKRIKTIREIITVLEEQRSTLADIQAVLLRASHEDVMPDIIQRTETLDFKMIEKRNGRRAFK